MANDHQPVDKGGSDAKPSRANRRGIPLCLLLRWEERERRQQQQQQQQQQQREERYRQGAAAAREGKGAGIGHRRHAGERGRGGRGGWHLFLSPILLLLLIIIIIILPSIALRIWPQRSQHHAPHRLHGARARAPELCRHLRVRRRVLLVHRERDLSNLLLREALLERDVLVLDRIQRRLDPHQRLPLRHRDRVRVPIYALALLKSSRDIVND